jgi:hypothetical protein
MITPAQRIAPEIAAYQNLIKQALARMRVSGPGIIQDFDPVAQTATVQLAIRENILQALPAPPGGSAPLFPIYLRKDVAVVPLINVPVVFPRGGGYVMTFPIEQGDECLVIFADTAIDGWWQNGGIQNQVERRRHDISDGICIPGLYSQPNIVPELSESSIQLRTTDNPSVYFEIVNGQVTSSAPLHCTAAAKGATFTDQTGRIMTVVNGSVSNAEGFLQGLINSGFFSQATNAMNAARTIPDLQRFVNDLFGGFQGITSDISAQIVSLTTLAPGVTDLAEVITFITNLQAFILGPITNLGAQLTSITAQMTTLISVANARAAALGGSITIPPI